MKTKLAFAIVLLAPSLVGWRKVYIEPTQNFAEVRLVNSIPRNLLAHSYAEADRCVGAMDVGGVRKSSVRVVRVALGTPATLSLQHFPPANAKSCLRAFSFLPKGGHIYEATLSWNAESEVCSLNLIDRDIASNASTSSSFVEREYKPPLFASAG